MYTQRGFSAVPRDKVNAQGPPHSEFLLSEDEKLAVMEALDHIHVTKQYQQMGSCSLCKKISIKTCSACGTFYCSSECQTYDWPKHRDVCSGQRDNGSDRNSMSSSRKFRSSSAKNVNGENLLMTDRSSPFTALANQLNRKPGSEFGGSLANFKIGNKQYQSREEISKGGEAGNSLNSGGNEQKFLNAFDRKRKSSPRKGSTCKKSPSECEKWNNGIGGNSVKSSYILKRKSSDSVAEVRAKIEPTVSKIGKTEVVGTYRESAERYWVMDVNSLRRYEEIQDALNRTGETYTTVTPKVGLVCSCSFLGEWFRGKILSLNPVTAHFLDFGNRSECEKNVFRGLPDYLQQFPGLAFLIEFDESTSSHYRTADLDSVKFEVEGTGVAPDGVPRVKVNERGAASEEKAVSKPPERGEAEVGPLAKHRSVMSTLTSSSQGVILLMPGDGQTRYGSLVPDENKEANDCMEKVLEMESATKCCKGAREGDFVLVTDKEGNDQRGKVISNLGSTYFVQLVDCGNVISTDRVFPLSDDLKKLMVLGVKITVEEEIQKGQMDKLESCLFSITGEHNSGRWPCTLKNTCEEVVAKALLEVPPERTGWTPKYVHLKSGATVEMSASAPPDCFYIRPVDAEAEQQFLDMNMEMIQYAPKVQSTAVPPSPGELCCAKFQEDGCFYRAIINAVEKGKANVLFVDFGNEQETQLTDVKPLTPALKAFPFFAVKVKLSNTSEKPWNNMIKDYITRLTLENIELVLTYEGSIENGVTLREKVSGVVVNEFIEKTKDRSKLPQPLKSELSLSPKSELFLDDDLDYTTVPKTTVCDVAILHVNEFEFETNYTFWATISGENFDYVNGDLNSLISEHCSGTKTPHQPSYRELCLAEFEGCWYRAICAGRDKNTFKVFFVDFGNVCELRAESIRKMEQKFMKAPALAMNCIVNGHEKLNKNSELVEKVCGFLLEKENTLIEGVEVSKYTDETYKLKIPEIEKIIFG